MLIAGLKLRESWIAFLSPTFGFSNFLSTIVFLVFFAEIKCWRLTICYIFNRLERKNSHIAQALESSKNDFEVYLARLEMTQKDIELVFSPLFERQRCRDFSSEVESNEAVETCESREENHKVYANEREGYGDMEELD